MVYTFLNREKYSHDKEKNADQTFSLWDIAFYALLVFFVLSLLIILETFFGIPSVHGDLIFLTTILVVATIAIALVAWFQISSLNKTTKADFLLRLDEPYCSGEILEAREILIKLGYDRYCACKAHIIHNELEKILRNKQEEAKDYMKLINLLDFLETLAYFKQEGHLSDTDFNELFGKNVIPAYGRAFKPFLDFFDTAGEPERYQYVKQAMTDSKI